MPGVATYMVNLERATARRALMEEHCAARGIAVSFFPAVDGSDPQVAARLAALPDEGPLGAFFPHDKACTLSHLDILQAFIGGKAEYCLVLEDDVFLAGDLAAWLAEIEQWWPAGSDLVKLERWRNDRLVVALSRKSSAHRGRHLHRLRSRHTGTGGYLISQSGARKVLAGVAANGGVPSVPIDHLLFNPQASAICRDLMIAQVEPALLVQGNDPAGTPPAKPRRPTGEALARQKRKRLRLEWLAARDMILMWLRGEIRPARITYADSI